MGVVSREEDADDRTDESQGRDTGAHKSITGDKGGTQQESTLSHSHGKT